MLIRSSTLDLHMQWQTTMEKPPIDRSYVEKALQKILSGEIEADVYPGGQPTLLGTYTIAAELQKTQSTVH